MTGRLPLDELRGWAEELAAVLEKGTRADSRILSATLAGLAEVVAREQVVSPALIVIGDVAGRAEEQTLRQLESRAREAVK